MGRFGFGKKSDDGDEDSNRLALFGSRSKSKSPAPSSNPYAQPSTLDPYTQVKLQTGDPYTQAKIKAGVLAPPPGTVNTTSANRSKSPSRLTDNKYSQPSVGGYAPNTPGDQAAYGRDRYGGGSGSRYGPGGYGGLGSRDPNDPEADENRNALFGDARERFQARQQQQQNDLSAPPPYTPGVSSGSPADGSAPNGGTSTYGTYGTYQERQLTAEEEEEEDIQAIKQEIKFIKQQDVASTRNALRAAAQAEETGRNTLARLGAQGERIHNTEKNLDLAANQNRIAEEKSRELKRLNKSMFAMNINNPFTSAQRRRERDEAIIERHHQERIQREETRLAAFRTEQRMEQTFKEISKPGDIPGKKAANLAERSKYQFEADSEDDEMENEIESNLAALQGAAGRLNALARATGRELEEQNKHLDRIIGKSDMVDDQIHMNRVRLDRIH
ncbi:hypothetical protein VTO42DRAFT_4797 [Malbranchea cinnamomea]